MVKVRTDIHFRSEFPDDTVEENGETVVWPGRNIMEMLKAAFEELGYRVSEPAHVPGRGWDLNLLRNTEPFCIKINVVEREVYLMAGGPLMWLPMQQRAHRPFLIDLDRIVKAEPRIHDVSWYPKGKIQETTPWTVPIDD